jgi:hypothetical protein
MSCVVLAIPFLRFQMIFWPLEEEDPVVKEIDRNGATEEGSQILDPVGMVYRHYRKPTLSKYAAFSVLWLEIELYCRHSVDVYSRKAAEGERQCT